MVSRRRKRSIEELVTVDEFELRWTLRSEPRWTVESGYQGLTFSVQLADAAHRELILEFPYPGETPTGYVSALERPDISPKSIEAAIRRAMVAGWNPVSRGRPFFFAVPGDID